MEQPRTKNKIATKESNDFTFRVLCVAPKSLPANTDTAVYEIDIQSDFEFCSGNGRMRLKDSSGEISVKGITTRDSSTETKRQLKRQDSKSRMIQSYYPTLLDTCSEESESQMEIQPKFKEVAFAVDMEESHIEKGLTSKTVVTKSILEVGNIEKPDLEIVEVQKPVVEITEVQEPVLEITEVQKSEVPKPVVQIAKIQKPVVHVAGGQKPISEKPEVQITEVQQPEIPKPVVEIGEGQPLMQTVDAKKSSLGKPNIKRSNNVKPSSQKSSVQKVVIERADVNKTGIEEVGMRKLGIESSDNVDLEKGGVRKVGVRKINIDKADLEKADTEKLEKENQASISEKLQQHIKSFLIENFFKKNNPDLKALFQNYEKKVEPNELHLHHHEHHHHYYFDGNPFGKGSIPPGSPPKEPPKPDCDWPAEKNPDPSLNAGPGPSVFYHCEAKSNSTFRVTKSRVSEELKDGRLGSAQCSVSEESIFDQKSEFLKSHTYSETDIPNVQNEIEDTRTQKPKERCKESLDVLATSLKNAAQYKSPVIITEHEKLPKFSYIACECKSLETIPQTSTVSFSSDLNTEGPEELEELEELGNSEKTSAESESSAPTG